MEHSTIDIRDLDCLYLATIGGVDYYEVRQIVKQDNGVRRIVGQASDWPIIEARSQRDEYAGFAAAFARTQAEADNQLLEARSREHTLLDHIAALEAALRNDEGRTEPPIAEQMNADRILNRRSSHLSAVDARDEAAAPTAPAEQAAPAQNQARMFQAQAAYLNGTADAALLALDRQNDGRIQCDHPGCLDWVKPRGLHTHKKRAHGISTTGMVTPPAATDMGGRKKCPYCAERPKAVGMQAHIARRHPDQLAIVPTPTPALESIALGERPWACARCGSGTHARSLAQPALCIRCVAAQADTLLTNGHLAAA